MIFRFSLVSPLPGLLARSLQLSLPLMASLSLTLSAPPIHPPPPPPPLHNLSLYPLSGLCTEVSVQSSSSSPPLSLSLSNPLLSFPLQSSVDCYTLRSDQSALLQSSWPDLLSPLLHGDLVSLFHLDAADPPPLLFYSPRLFLAPSRFQLSRLCFRLPLPLWRPPPLLTFQSCSEIKAFVGAWSQCVFVFFFNGYRVAERKMYVWHSSLC